MVKTNKEKFDEIKKFYDAEVTAALDYAIITAKNDEDRKAAEIDKIRTEAQEKLALLDENSFQYKMVHEQMLKDIADKEKEYADKSIETEKEKQQRRLSAVETATSAITDIANQLMANTQKRNDRELSMVAQKNATEKAQLKEQLDAKLISQAQYDAEIEKLDRQYAEKEAAARQQEMEQQKLAAMFSAAIKVIMAWIEAYINPLKVPQAIAASAQQAVLVGLQVPEFYEGGYLPKTGNDREAFPIIAHGNEYMVPANEMRDPAVANFAAMVETSRTGGASVSQQMSQMQASQQASAPQTIVQTDPNLVPIMERLLNVLENGVRSEVVFDDERVFKLKKQLKDQTEKDNMISF